MRKSRFSEEKMVEILREADRVPVAEVSKKHGVSEQCVFRPIVTGRPGIVTGDSGIVTGRSGDVTEGCLVRQLTSEKGSGAVLQE